MTLAPGSDNAPLTPFPLARVKKIAKSDKQVGMVAAESLFLISNAAVTTLRPSKALFIEQLVFEASQVCKSEKRKTIAYSDIGRVAHRC